MAIPTVTFLSVDPEKRKAYFEVDGVQVVRGIPEQFEGTIDDYLIALGRGLVVEFTTQEPKPIDTPSLSPGELLNPESQPLT